jgi:hypothetical protein
MDKVRHSLDRAHFALELADRGGSVADRADALEEARC